MASPKIKTYREIIPLIYSWRTPDVPKYEGWEKIGYTEQETADAIGISLRTAQRDWLKARAWLREALGPRPADPRS